MSIHFFQVECLLQGLQRKLPLPHTPRLTPSPLQQVIHSLLWATPSPLQITHSLLRRSSHSSTLSSTHNSTHSSTQSSTRLKDTPILLQCSFLSHSIPVLRILPGFKSVLLIQGLPPHRAIWREKLILIKLAGLGTRTTTQL